MILVAYRNTDALSEALSALDGFDVLVVDNGGEADVEGLVTTAGATYLAPGANVGFAAAVNLGLARRRGRDVLLVNPDARVSSDTVGALRRALDADDRLCAVAPQLVGEQDDAQRVEWPIPSPRVEWVKAFRLQRLVPPERTFLIGAVLLLRGDALADVGEFDERFFLYAEECDWQLRAQRRGWRIAVVNDAIAVHKGGGSSPVESRRQELFHRSARLFGVKWYGEAGWTSMQVASRTGNALRLVATLPDGKRRARYARRLRL